MIQKSYTSYNGLRGLAPVLVAVDAGKTNLRVALVSPDLTEQSRWTVPVQDLPAALDALRLHLQAFHEGVPITGVGLSIFGPLATDPQASNYGAIPESSDASWTGCNLPALISDALHQPVSFDYDVRAGALAEATLGAARELDSFVYLSVGTGVGGVYHGSASQPGYAPQLGHMYLPQEPDDLNFRGTCRFHGNCLQGLASGRALAARWGVSAEHLLPEHPAWDLEARYLARACANLIYTFSPQAILLGSSVGLVAGLVNRINAYLPGMLNSFLEPELRTRFAHQPAVLKAALTPDSSLLGAAVLARDGQGLRFSPYQ